MSSAPSSSADPKASPGDQHEMKDMSQPPPSLPIEEDVMQLARLGEIGAIQKLFDTGKCDATYRDEQGITPLHVRALRPPPSSARALTESLHSGLPSTTTTLSATSSSTPAPT